MYMLIIPAIFITLGIAYSVYMNKAHAEAKGNFNREQELDKIDQTKEELLSNDLAFIKGWMKGEAIDSVASMRVPVGVKGHAKQIAKNTLKSAAWAVVGVKAKYKTVEVDNFIVLSGNTLHLLFRDLEGDLKQHTTLNAETLKNARLEEMETGVKSMLDRGIGANLAAKAVQIYSLKFMDDEGKEKVIDIYTHLIINAFGSESHFKQLQANLLAENFITKLGQTYPNLKAS